MDKLLDWIGLDWIGLDWIGLDWIGLDWIGLVVVLYVDIILLQSSLSIVESFIRLLIIILT